METVLVVEDSRAMQRTLQRLLEADSLQVQIASDGIAGLETFRKQPPSAVLLDLKLPGLSGKELCREFKTIAASVPIVVLSANAEVEDKVLLLELGADDYVTKPFSPRELMARVRAVLRRASEDDVIEAAGITLDRTRREVRVGETPVAVTPTEYRLLDALAHAGGRTFTRQELVERALGEEYDGLDRTVDVHIMNLRRKLGDAGKAIVTVFGVGYKFAR